MSTRLTRFDDQISWTAPQEDHDSPVIGFVAGSRATLMVDACSSHRHTVEVLHEMRAHGINNPDYALITHSHPDHWFGLIDFETTVAICSLPCLAKTQAMTHMDWSHDGHRGQVEAGESYEMLHPILDAEYGVDRDGIALRSPDIGIRGELVVDLGGLTAVAREFESSHWDGQLIVHIPEKGVVFLGDALYIREENEAEIAQVLDTIDSLGATWFIYSHADAVMTRAQVETHLREYAASL
jgi:glyoxylase-like metal-dependent hydrolase (beta-lactamase superfamily II)